MALHNGNGRPSPKDKDDTSLIELSHSIVFLIHAMAAMQTVDPVKLCDTLIHLAPRKYIKETLAIMRTHFRQNHYPI